MSEEKGFEPIAHRLSAGITHEEDQLGREIMACLKHLGVKQWVFFFGDDEEHPTHTHLNIHANRVMVGLAMASMSINTEGSLEVMFKSIRLHDADKKCVEAIREYEDAVKDLNKDIVGMEENYEPRN